MATTIGSLDLNAFSDLHSDLTQYFWFEPNATATYGAGAHVTLVPDTSFISNPTGQNILMNTDGFSIRNGLLPMMTLDNDSLDFNVVDTTAGTYTTTATFTSTGAQIGQSGAAHSVIDANGQRFYASDGTTQLANIGYGDGVDGGGGISDAPYYAFGTRNNTTAEYSSTRTYDIGDLCLYDDGNGYKTYVCTTDITTPRPWDEYYWTYYIGNYSMAEGYLTTASGFASHAEGYYTNAIGYYAHAEGYFTKVSEPYSHSEGNQAIASGMSSHAEGFLTKASGHVSHAEGDRTITRGSASHAQNRGTIASKRAQTALGTYNEEDISATTIHPSDDVSYGQYAVIVGNGTDKDHRSNAFTVDWSGNMWAENYYPVGSVYIHQDNTNPADILGFGTWTQIHRRFRYAIVEDAVTFNSTNVNTATGTGSVCILDGDTAYLRLTVTTKVALTDTPSIKIGTLDFSKIGLTTCYYGQFPFLTDNGNGIAMFSLNHQNGVIQSEDVITKASNGTIAAGATGYCMIPILFARGSMIDSFCNEFHWRRTA